MLVCDVGGVLIPSPLPVILEFERERNLPPYFISSSFARDKSIWEVRKIDNFDLI